jgi:hypothetical protein
MQRFHDSEKAVVQRSHQASMYFQCKRHGMVAKEASVVKTPHFVQAVNVLQQV